MKTVYDHYFDLETGPVHKLSTLKDGFDPDDMEMVHGWYVVKTAPLWKALEPIWELSKTFAVGHRAIQKNPVEVIGAGHAATRWLLTAFQQTLDVYDNSLAKLTAAEEEIRDAYLSTNAMTYLFEVQAD